MIMGCDILIDKCIKFTTLFQSEKVEYVKDNTTLPNSYDVILQNEDYTLGKVIEYLLHEQHYKKEKDVNLYRIFLKKHPHINYSIVRIAFKNKDQANSENVTALFVNVLSTAKLLFENIKEYFKV